MQVLVTLFDIGGVDYFYVTSSGFLQITGNTGYKSAGSNWTNPSDERLKEEIEDFNEGLEVLEQIRPRKFKLKNGDANNNCSDCNKHVGIIAQELLPIYPRAIKEGDDGMYQFDGNDFIYISINSVKQLTTMNQALTQRVQALENIISNLNI